LKEFLKGAHYSFGTISKFTHFGSEEPNFSSMNLGNQSVFNRKTDKRSYEDGRAFMFYLDSILKERPEKSLKKFLRIYYNKRKFSTVDQEDFRKDLEEYYGGSLRDIFNQYIYGLGDHSDSEGPNPFHSSISDDELGELI
jgi:predicted metalloprotease with PDZ domain